MGEASSSSDFQEHKLGKTGSQKKEQNQPLLSCRRMSKRIKAIPVDKRPFYGDVQKRQSDFHHDNNVSKKTKVGCAIQDLSNVVRVVQVEDNGAKADAIVSAECGDGINTKDKNSNDLRWTQCKRILVDFKGISDTAMVKETLAKYNKYCLQFVQKGASRPDLKAMSEMVQRKEILYPGKIFGNLPGINVGRQFFSRAEMVSVGLHGHWFRGIDYVGESCTGSNEYNGYTLPLAVAVVMSGQYEDDVDSSDEIVYTGSGGNDHISSKSQIKDQVLSGGNLALKNNMEQRVPVRVVRGHLRPNGNSQKVYTYCGLYMVEDFYNDNGKSGYNVLKYHLRRLQGQFKLEINQVHFSKRQGAKSSSELPGLVCKDISNGQEDVPILATNMIDDPPVAPTGFEYTKSIQVVRGVNIPASGHGCKCKGKCTSAKFCACAQLNGTDFPYVYQEKCGKLIEPRNVVFECGPACGCGPDCVNRTSQKGIKYRLEVYRTEDKGWAVRSWDFIPSGAPVCEYAGVLRKNNELDNVSENDYIFEIDCLQTMNGIDGREKREGVESSLPTSGMTEKVDEKILEAESEFCIDACAKGNIARFINHSCEPNLFVQCVLSSHHDIRLAKVMLFASDPILPFQELTYDYGYALDSVVDPDGKIKQLACHCGTPDCRKRLY